MKDKKDNSKTAKLVRAINSKKNVEAYKLLEQVVRQKVADKISDALNEE